MKRLNKRAVILGTIFGFILAATIVVGRQICAADTIELSSIKTYILIFGLGIMASLASIFLFINIQKVWEYLFYCKVERLLQRPMSNEKRFLVLSFILMVVVWFVGLLACYPGIYAYDSAFQMRFYEVGPMTAHHPILHTYMLGWCVDIGRGIFNSPEVGVFIYSIIQILLMALMFTYMLHKLKTMMPHFVRLITALGVAFIPYNVMLSFSVTKDVLFAGLTIMVLIKSYEMVLDLKGFFKSKKAIISYVITVFLMCAMRNNGIYCFLVLGVLLIVIGKGVRIKSTFVVVGVCIFWMLYTGPFYKALGIEPGLEAEALSVPMQQMARVMKYTPDDISEDEFEEAAKFIPAYDRYIPRISDNVKDYFDNDYYVAHKKDFYSIWAKIGMKNPGTYIDAWASLTVGYWYTGMKYPDPGTYINYLDFYNRDMSGASNATEYFVIKKTSYIPWLSDYYENFAAHVPEQNIPIYNIVFSPGIMFFMLLFCILYVIYKKEYKDLIPMGLLFGLWLTLLLSPAVLFRYAYPICVCMPFVITIALNFGNKKSSDISEL